MSSTKSRVLWEWTSQVLLLYEHGRSTFLIQESLSCPSLQNVNMKLEPGGQRASSLYLLLLYLNSNSGDEEGLDPKDADMFEPSTYKVFNLIWVSSDEDY